MLNFITMLRDKIADYLDKKYRQYRTTEYNIVHEYHYEDMSIESWLKIADVLIPMIKHELKILKWKTRKDSNQELIEFVNQIKNDCEINGSIRIKARKLLESINS